MSITFNTLLSNFDTFYSFEAGEKVTGSLLYSIGALALATNLVSTSLIAYRLWTCRREWNTGFGSRWSHAQKILLMMVESGAVYAAIQLLAVATFDRSIKPGTARGYFKDIVWEGYIQTTMMYPTIVLLLIEQKVSFTDMDCFTSGTTQRYPTKIWKLQSRSQLQSGNTLVSSEISSG